MSSFKGKVVAVTGAASGIGLALTKILASRGAKLALADVQQDALNKIVEEVKSQGNEVVGTIVDVSNNAQVDDWINSTVKHFGSIDAAANVAGIDMKFTDIEDLTNEVWDKIIAVNLTGVMYCLRAQVRVMKAGSVIVNMASIAGMMGRAGLGAYVCSKHGVVGLTKVAAKELGPKGIRVNAIAPGPIETPMLARVLAGGSSGSSKGTLDAFAALPLRRKGQAEEVAQTFAFVLSDDASFMTGSIVTVDGGTTC